ncbi:MAG: MerR family transcriptional regulator [Firmicutes bacterium]|nr:MerR family transcriptional regulator [Bacillota bacterium]
MNEKHEAFAEKTTPQLYKIGMFAQMNHITIKTLRFYEEQGLLLPAYVDGENGYRYYTMNQMADIQRITALKQAGFTLDDIKLINQGADTAYLLSTKKAALLKKIAELTSQIAVIDGYLSGPAGTLDAPVLIRTIPAVTVASMKKRIDSYDELFSLMPEMGAEMERLGCRCALPEYCFTHYLEPGFRDEHILIETCEAVTEKKEDSALVKFRELPEITAACIFHKGSYSNFSESYAAILRFIEENGYKICGNIRENYIDGIWNKDREEDWLSEIQIPVRIG